MGRVALLVLGLSLCGLTACGGGSSASPDATMRAYINAIAEGPGHGPEVCGYLTGTALKDRGGKDCAAEVEYNTVQMSATDASAIRHLKFKVVRVHDDTATVTVAVPHASCEAGRVQQLSLVKKDGDWLISRTADNVCAGQF